MKRLTLLICSLFILQTMQAGNHFGRQMSSDDNKKFTFSFNGGIGFPQLDFGKKGTLGGPGAQPATDSTHAYGFATSGFHFDIGISYRFTDYIGVAARIGGTICSFDAGSYQSAYPNIPNIPPSTETVNANGSHYVAEYLIGPYFYIPAGDEFAFEIKALGGIVSEQYPDFTISSTDSLNHSAEDFKYAHASEFGYCFSVGARYKLDNMIGLSATVSYTGASVVLPGWAYSYTTPSGFTYTGFSFSNRNMSLGIVSITLGMNISF